MVQPNFVWRCLGLVAAIGVVLMATKEHFLIRAARLRAIRGCLDDPLGLPILDAVIAALEEAAEERDARPCGTSRNHD
jgi:hypothetical protein